MTYNLLKITTNLSELPDQYVVYSLSDAEGVKYIGVCKFVEMPVISDARSNTLFPTCFPEGKIATLEMVWSNPKKHECLIQAARLVEIYKPIMNLKGFVHTENTAPITCNETGEVFQTIADVCMSHNISAGNLSQHLNHKPGFKSIKGKTYRRGGPKPARGSYESYTRKIKNIETGEEFESCAELARVLKVTPGSVTNHLRRRLKQLKGQVYSYV